MRSLFEILVVKTENDGASDVDHNSSSEESDGMSTGFK
jgi:hypothetical protein